MDTSLETELNLPKPLDDDVIFTPQVLDAPIRCPAEVDGCWVETRQRHVMDHVYNQHWPIMMHKFEQCLYNMSHFVPTGNMETHLQTCDDFAIWKRRQEVAGRPNFALDKASLDQVQVELDKFRESKSMETAGKSVREVAVSLLEKQLQMTKLSKSSPQGAKLMFYKNWSDAKFLSLVPE